ncbi:MAG: two-component system sensor histidine kinase NtrB, partial [Bacteroidota bacterium]
INKVYAEGKPQKLIRLTRPNDENHWEINRQPIFNKNDEVESVLITWHRITEQVMLHRRIETQEQQFIRFIHSAQDWISIKDTEGRYLIVNPVTAEAMKIPLEEFIGKKPSELLPPGLVKQIEENDRIVLNDKKPRTFREIIPIDGQDHHFQTVRFPLMDYSGKITGVCTIARDITNEVMLKDQLIQYEKLAGLGKLAAGVAHEINNPLTGILAYAEGIAEDHEDDVELTSDMDVIIRETLRCREIVRNLLDFARQDKPRFSRVTVSRLMNDTFNLIKKLKQFKNIEFIIQEDDEDRALDIDINQMRQVMLNLLLNSADVMNGKGRILISYGPDRRDSYYRITIEDNGPGIPEDIVDKIFEPFFSTKGTSGLGLAVSLGIVQMHGGTIEVSNAAGCGARFNIILPMER